MPNIDYSYLIKLIFVGNSYTGKSSISQRFVENTFSEKYNNTIGMDFRQKIMPHENFFYKLMLWELAGGERFRELMSNYYTKCSGVLLVFNISDEHSFKSIDNYYKDYIKTWTENHIKLILIGNFCDLVSKRKVSFEEANLKAQKLGIPYIETSANTGHNISLAIEMLTQQIFDDPIILEKARIIKVIKVNSETILTGARSLSQKNSFGSKLIPICIVKTAPDTEIIKQNKKIEELQAKLETIYEMLNRMQNLSEKDILLKNEIIKILKSN